MSELANLKEELSIVENIITNTKRLIKKYPDDNALPIDLIQFESIAKILREGNK
ncbi:MAG: hypothetical protein ISP01_05355 [Methanobrevibacter arboriphilus]|uniref:Uncharacterized protein n=1 Tax=Methanobrevibacter arboriphilus TaxID=39441 RepID=A0A843AIC6_METAZ|nr:hypothetical protein [Methanobrevibacter arboriphilus]MBF4468815.1 hypothetical protein [Methanobrevibacter arboriphilus]